MKKLMPVPSPPDKRKIESVISSVTTSGVKADMANLSGDDEGVISRQHNPSDAYKHPAFAYIRDMWARSSVAPESFRAIRSLVDRHLDQYEDVIEGIGDERNIDEWAVALNSLFETFINSYMRRKPEHEIAAAAELFGVKFAAFQRWLSGEKKFRPEPVNSLDHVGDVGVMQGRGASK